jgi:hypothetical protein
MRKPSVLLSGFSLFLMCACTPAHYVADRGRHLIVGMDAATLKSCAGIPTRTDRLDPRTELYSYEIKYEYTNGAQVTLPIIGGGFNLGQGRRLCANLPRVPARVREGRQSAYRREMT